MTAAAKHTEPLRQFGPYRVVDTKTGQIIGAFADLKAARRKADRLDSEYGAVRYMVTRLAWGQS